MKWEISQVVDRNIKLWNINNFQCLYDYKNVYNDGYLYSVCFLKKDDLTFVAASKNNFPGDSENIKIFDFNGNKTSELSNSNDNIIFIDTYYDNKLSTNFIITGNIGFVKSYNYNEDKVYHKYNDGGNAFHRNINIYDKDSKLSLLEICCDGNIRIWNFHSGELLNRIKVYEQPLFSICLWNDQYIFVGCDDGAILLIDLNNGSNIKTLISHEDSVLTIRKLVHPLYGECLISKGVGNEQIKLWVLK
jgi:WD40 repeat protein